MCIISYSAYLICLFIYLFFKLLLIYHPTYLPFGALLEIAVELDHGGSARLLFVFFFSFECKKNLLFGSVGAHAWFSARLTPTHTVITGTPWGKLY